MFQHTVPASHKTKGLINPFTGHSNESTAHRVKDGHLCHAVVHKTKHATVDQVGEEDTTGATFSEGTTIVDDRQLVVLDITLVDGTTGETIATSAYDGDLSQPFQLSQFAQSIPSIEQPMQCTGAGSRVVVAVPPGGIDPQTAASFGLTDQDSTVAVIDVRKVYLDRESALLLRSMLECREKRQNSHCRCAHALPGLCSSVNIAVDWSVAAQQQWTMV